MLVQKSQLLVFYSNKDLFFKALSEFEYKPNTIIDIILLKPIDESFINKTLNILAYFSQTNYLNHNFRIFTPDNNFIDIAKNKTKTLGINQSTNFYKIIDLINFNIMNTERYLYNLNNYDSISLIKEDKIEVFYEFDKLMIRV